MKRKPKDKAKAPAKKEYTHRDHTGMRWRMSGTRPVSELADFIMRQAGIKLPP